MAHYQANTSRFALLNGEPLTREEPSLFVAADAQAGAVARKGMLYIVAECDEGPRAAEACQLAIKTIQRYFYEDSSFSVTAALRKAIVRANRVLYERNFGANATHRALVGVSCAVLKDDHLYIAQIAPAQAYLCASGSLRALPTHPSWSPAHTSATPFLKPNALGSSLFIEPEFSHSTMQLGDTFLLCSSAIARYLPRDAAQHLLQHDQTPTESLITLCREQGLTQAQGLVVRLLPRDARAAQAPSVAPGRATLRRVVAWGSGLLGEGATLMRRRAVEEQVPLAASRPPTEPPLAEPIPRPRPIDTGQSLDDRQAAQVASRRQQAEHMAQSPSTYLGEQTYTSARLGGRAIDLGDPAPNPRFALRPRDEVKPLVDMTLGERVALPFQQAAAAVSELFGRRERRRLAPPGFAKPRPAPPRSQGLSYRRHQPKPFPWQLLVVLTVLVGALVFYGYNLTQENARQETRSALDSAEEAMAAVRSAPDETQALLRLDAAQQAISQVQSSAALTKTNSADWLRFEQIQREFSRAQASLQRVSFVEGQEVVASHPVAGNIFSRVIVPNAEATDAASFAYVYGFDERTRTLYRMPYDGGAPTPILKPNDEVQGVLVGDLVLAAWRTDSIVAVDRNVGSNIFFRNGDTWYYNVLATSEEWPRDAQLQMDVYLGHIYFWNAANGQILRYLAGNYGNPPDPWIVDYGGKEQEIESSIDMAIDGNIYLLQPNGTVLALEGGAYSREIVPSNIDPPLSVVTRFAVLGPPESGSFLLVDTLNERIIQIDKQTGELIQQLRLPVDSDVRLDQLSDVAVDERSSRPLLYLVNGPDILRFPLPAPPQPFQPQAPTAVTR
jgi:serine/threonine protein phosphatase PrpC